MNSWAARISMAHASLVAGLRLHPLECAEDNDAIWVRGRELSDELDTEIRKVPDAQVFDLTPPDQLKPKGSRITDGRLPQLVWRPIKDAFPLSFPTAALPGETRQRVAITLVRTSVESPASALLISLQSWIEYSTSAPDIRLRVLRFAASEDRQVLIIGTPLPPISGTQLVNCNGVLVPCGSTWSPGFETNILKQALGVAEDDLVILFADNTHQIINKEQIVPASRASARLTVAEFEP